MQPRAVVRGVQKACHFFALCGAGFDDAQDVRCWLKQPDKQNPTRWPLEGRSGFRAAIQVARVKSQQRRGSGRSRALVLPLDRRAGSVRRESPSLAHPLSV